jgi:putative membrane protein
MNAKPMETTLMASDAAEKATSRLDATKLALENTRLAYERTMMAWVRTATALIGFGFTIYKFLQYTRDNEPGAPVQHLVGPRGYGIFFISLGLFTLLLATLQHRQSMKILRAQYPEAPVSLSALLAAVFSAFGLLALLAAIFRQ